MTQTSDKQRPKTLRFPEGVEAMLEQLARHVLKHGADSWASETANRLLRFFDSITSHPAMANDWNTLRPKLARIRAGEWEWLRATEVRRFVRRHVEVVSRERTPMAGTSDPHGGANDRLYEPL